MKKLIAISSLLSLSTAMVTAEAATYRIKGRIDTQVLNSVQLIEKMDRYSVGIAGKGDLKLVISNASDGSTIDVSKTENGVPTFTIDKIYETNSDTLSIKVDLIDRDWFGITHQKTAILSLSIAADQNVVMDSLLFPSTDVVRIYKTSDETIRYARIGQDKKIIEQRNLESVKEYQDLVNTSTNQGYDLEITRLK